MKYLFAVLALSTCVGCASQPSTYEDRSTPEQRDIKATGQAATEAARSNTSRNGNIQTGVPIKLSHIDQYDIQNGRYVVIGPDGKRDHRAELRMMQQNMHNRNGRQGIGTYTQNRMSREWDHRIKRKIDDEIDRFMEKIF